jgi:hypothetical protein
LEQFLDPSRAPVRNALGRLIRNQKPVIVTRAPGRGGMGSFSARRLARTEITRAHGLATIEVAKRTPFALGVKWSLSGRHPKSDPCDENARRDEYRLGAGIYPPERVPSYPNHSMCLCTLSTATESDVDGVVRSLREQYGLGTENAVTEESAAGALASADRGSAAQQTPTFKNKDEIRKYFESLGITVEGTGGNINAWRMVAKTFARESAAGSTFPPKIVFAGGGRNSVAQFSQSFDRHTGEMVRQQIEFKTGGTFWRDMAGQTQKQFDAGFWSSNDPSHAITHELAHFRHREVAPQADIYGYTLNINGEIVSARWTNDAEKEIARRVSRYGASDPSEFVAETYAGIRAGNEYDDDVMALYRKWGGPSL